MEQNKTKPTQKPLAFVTGYGQLCNNILQFGHLYAWGKNNGIDIIGMRFCYKYPFFKINQKKEYNWFTYLFAKYGYKLKFIPKVSFMEEKDVNQHNINNLFKNKYSLIEGWHLRDYEAFIQYKNEIKDLFSFKNEIVLNTNEWLPPKTATIRLGVHIRRGDYIRWMEGKYFYTDKDFINIIHQFIHLFPDKKIEIILVSNEKSLNKDIYLQNIKIPVYFISGNPGEDLYALSTCDYIIGPPSTFSLMASFYNDSNLYWVLDKNKKLDSNSFQKFEVLFKEII